LVSFDSVKDSGERTSFATGSVRDKRTGKGRFDLLSPHVLRRDARHMENGAVKYGDRNWERGQPLSVFFDSAMRHLVAFVEGKVDEDHLAAARWNIGAIMHVSNEVANGRLPEALVDLPNVRLEDLKRVLKETPAAAHAAKPTPKRRYFDRHGYDDIPGYWTFMEGDVEAAYIEKGRVAVKSAFSIEELISGHRGVFEVPHAPF
jgi:hypothetical protein